MPWFRLDESFHSHPKVQRAGNTAVGLWVRCGTWSAQYLTDGVIPPEVYGGYGRPGDISKLVDTHLWLPTDDGMVMPDYLDYNPSKVDVEQRRKDDAERKRRSRGRGSDDDPFP
jgi:hypothetical protein